MNIPKKYGYYKVEPCPFCSKQATAKNFQDVPVCMTHKDRKLPDLKCACGSYLDMKHGKFGVYFSCMGCGNLSMAKALSLNPNLVLKTHSNNEKIIQPTQIKSVKKFIPKETTVTSHDVDVYYS